MGRKSGARNPGEGAALIGRGDDADRNPRRAQIARLEFFELTLLWALDKQLPVEQFEAAASQSTAPPPCLLGQVEA